MLTMLIKYAEKRIFKRNECYSLSAAVYSGMCFKGFPLGWGALQFNRTKYFCCH